MVGGDAQEKVAEVGAAGDVQQRLVLVEVEQAGDGGGVDHHVPRGPAPENAAAQKSEAEAFAGGVVIVEHRLGRDAAGQGLQRVGIAQGEERGLQDGAAGGKQFG